MNSICDVEKLLRGRTLHYDMSFCKVRLDGCSNVGTVTILDVAKVGMGLTTLAWKSMWAGQLYLAATTAMMATHL